MRDRRTTSDDSDKSTATTADTTPSDTTASTHAERKENDRAARERRDARGAEHGQEREVGATDPAAHGPSLGGGAPTRRLLLICLDGATPELAIGAWRTQLRTMHMLTDRGARGALLSSVPCSSAPAWLSLLTGQEPGRNGVYGRTRRPNHSYAAPAAPTSLDVAEPRLWDMLGAGRRVGVIGGPATLPPPPVHGCLLAEHPDGTLAAYPPELMHQLAGWLADDSRVDSAGDDLDQKIGRIYARSERRFRLARRLLARDAYDCFVVFDDGIAAVQRLLWHALDVTHPRHTPGHPFADVISAFYRFVDEQIADLLEMIDDGTIVAVVSACGAQALDGELALNDWLIEQGDLALFRQPAQPSALEACEVDWEHTRAWAGEDGAIYLNVAGREPQGSLPAADVERALAGLRERLGTLAQPGQTGATPAVITYRPATLYGAAHGVAPDLLAVCARPGWRTSASVGRGVWVNAREHQLESAAESPTGFFVVYDPAAPAEERVIVDATIYDVAPTLLRLIGEPIAPRLRGRVLQTLGERR